MSQTDIVGHLSGKIVAIAYRCAKCSICVGVKDDVDIPDHDCVFNHADKSSTMESAGAIAVASCFSVLVPGLLLCSSLMIS